MRFANQIVLVTGASRGLGAEMARQFAAEGASVMVAARSTAAGEGVASQIRANGGEAEFIALDTRYEDAWSTVLDHVVHQHGRLDVLVNNAGIGSGVGDGPSSDVTGFDRLMATNARGTFLGLRLAAEIMRARGGAIVNVGSIAGSIGMGGSIHAGYSASKAAVAMLTRSFAVREGPNSIRVNTVIPGLCQPMQGTRLTDGSEGRTDIISRIPLGRAAEDAEVAKAVLFLASADASYITGVDLHVDGGWHAGS